MTHTKLHIFWSVLWLLIVVLSIIGLQGCTSLDEQSAQSDQMPIALQQKPVPDALQKAFKEAIALQAKGDISQATKSFEALHEQYPEFSGAAVNVALLSMEKNPEKANAYLKQAIERNANNYYAYSLLGVIARQANEFETAKDYYLKTIEIEPSYANVWYNLAVLNEVYLGDFSEAIRAYEMLLALDQSDEKKIKKRIKKMIKLQGE